MAKLVLLSGGLDSTLCLDLAVEDGGKVFAVGFDYGQDHGIELEYAERTAARLGVPFKVIWLPKLPRPDGLVFSGRNLLICAYAITEAVALGCDSIVVGANKSDHKDFPDCRPEFFFGLSEAAKAYGVSVLTPLLGMSKSDVVRVAESRGLGLVHTWTCYSPKDGGPCGECYSCKGLQEAVKNVHG